MIAYPEAPRAWGYTRGMARSLGLSLPEAVLEGWLSRDELGKLVAACCQCAASGQCTTWLAQGKDSPTAPAFCPNGSALEQLRP